MNRQDKPKRPRLGTGLSERAARNLEGRGERLRKQIEQAEGKKIPGFREVK